MTTHPGAELVRRLRAVAVEVAMPTRPGLEEAVVLAEELVALGLGGWATVDMASLPRGATRADAGDTVRAMLAEWGMEVPPAEDDDARYRLLLRAFGLWDLPVARFERAFYARLVAWDQQSELDRALALLLHELDQLSTPGERLAVERRMRELVSTRFPT
ncbi:hypothetical protein [Thalassiella azotivora]